MKITAKDLLEFGIIEEIIEEPQGGAHRDLEFQSERIRAGLWKHLQELKQLSAEQLIEDRYNKFRKVGYFRMAEAEAEEQAAGSGADPTGTENQGSEAAPTLK